MSNCLSKDPAVIGTIKRLRRFAAMLTADKKAADAVVLDVVKLHLDPEGTSEDFGRIFQALLRDVYRNLYAKSDGSRKLSIMRKEVLEDVPALVKFQSLDIDSRAVVALHFLESLSNAEIGVIVDHSCDRVSRIVETSIEFLSLRDSDEDVDQPTQMTDSVAS